MDDGNAARGSRLAAEGDAVLRRDLRKLRGMTSDQGLVGGHDVLACAERFFEDLGGGVLAADELDHAVDIGVGYDAGRIRV